MNAKPSQTPTLPGYQLLEPLGRGGFGEVWKCEAPGGLVKAIKIVKGIGQPRPGEAAPAVEELLAIQRIKNVRHPYILSLDRVEFLGGDLIIIMELADQSLHDLLTSYRHAGQSGLPRDELLDYLEETAEALDVMNLQHGLLHLDVKPRNLFLVGGHVKVGDFGLVSSLTARSTAVEFGAVTPLYASPEVCHNTISEHSDQYSLAIVYHELLTGTWPFQGQSARQIMQRHCTEQPNLSLLPENDRPIVGRALAKMPGNRYDCCSDFVGALLVAGNPARTVFVPQKTDPVPPTPDTVNENSLSSTVRRLTSEATPASTKGPEPTVAGCQLLSRLTVSPVLETWLAIHRDGHFRQIKNLSGFARTDAQDERSAIAHLHALRHPGLSPLDVVHYEPGRLTLVGEHPKETLRDRFQQCQSLGWIGVPREELLDWLEKAAAILDDLQQKFQWQHLGLSPQHVLIDEPIRLIDFGLAQLLWLPSEQPLGTLNARYAAPELLTGGLSVYCDQYSLALIYQEMLTGTLPRPTSVLPSAYANAALYLNPLPDHDRPVVARALARDPRQRWTNCTEMIRALHAAGTGQRQVVAADGSLLAMLDDPTVVERLIQDLAAGITNPVPSVGFDGPRLTTKGLEQRVATRLPLSFLRDKLGLLAMQWQGRVVSDRGGELVFEVVQPLNLWRRLIGHNAGLTVQALLTAAPDGATVLVRIQPFGLSRRAGQGLLESLGTHLLASIAEGIQSPSERRKGDRLLLPRAVHVRFLLPNRQPSRRVGCQGKDISRTGIGFYLPAGLHSNRVQVELPGGVQDLTAMPARIVRARRTDDGTFEVGATFS